jgi:hypothetical protein
MPDGASSSEGCTGMVTVWAMTLGMIEVVVNSVDMKMLRNVVVGVVVV